MVKKIKAAHILVKTEQEADEIMAEISQGKDFASIAKEKSLCPSKEKGGNLGWFKKNVMVPEFEEACLMGEPGEIVGPIKTRSGWHIIKVEDMK